MEDTSKVKRARAILSSSGVPVHARLYDKLVSNIAEALLSAETRLLNVARGYHDYGGGYRSGDDLSECQVAAFHHGVQTVIQALESAAKDNPNNLQVNVLESIGARGVSH